VFGEIGIHFDGDYSFHTRKKNFGESPLARADFDDLPGAFRACRSRNAIKNSAALKEMLA
jgi:hypothetical protein